MTSERPDVTKDGRYSLKDTAELLSISTMTIRRHTKAGLLECGRWPHNGRVFYTGKEILRYWRDYAKHIELTGNDLGTTKAIQFERDILCSGILEFRDKNKPPQEP